MTLRALALGPVLLVGLVACGGGAASPGVATPAATASPTPTEAPSVAVPSPSTSDILHGAPELEALLPTSFRGEPVMTFSMDAAGISESGAGPALFPLVDAAGGDHTKMGFAYASTGETTTFNLIVMAGGGIDGQKLVDAYAGDAVATGESLSSSSVTLGGRTVTRLVSPASNPLGDLWIFAVGDVMYGVQSKDETIASELIGLLQ